jgi:DNA-directed RNA polymerase specialized sigma24 family protein
MKRKNVFTLIDHAIARAAVERLPRLQGKVIRMWFWRGMELHEIALEIGLPESALAMALIHAIRSLKIACVNHPDFSKTKS